MKLIFRLIVISMFFSLISASETEISEKRTYFSKTYSLEGGNYKTLLSTTPLHYKDADGNFLDIGEENDSQLTLARQQVAAENINIDSRIEAYGFYRYQKMTVETIVTPDTVYDDTTFSYENGYAGEESSTLGNYSLVVPEYVPDIGPEGILDENWRLLSSWCTNCDDIDFSGGAEVTSLDLEIELNSVIINPVRDFIIQLRDMGNAAIVDNPDADDYNSISSSSLIDDFNVEHYSYIYTYSTAFSFSSGSFFNNFVTSLKNRQPAYVVGMKHSTEDYSSYLEYESVSTIIYSAIITIYYQVPEVTLVNQRAGNNTGYLAGSLSLEHLSGTEDYLNKSSGTSVPVRINDDYSVWTHNEWLSDGVESVKHLNWNFNTVYKMVNDDFQMKDSYVKLAAEFDVTERITVSSPVSFSIRDPWYVSNPETFDQPNAFYLYSNVDNANGTYDVFLDQYPDQGPSYSLKTSKLTGSDGEYKVFRRWLAKDASDNTNSALADFTSQSGTQTNVVFKDGLSTVVAKYNSVSISGSDYHSFYASGNNVYLDIPLHSFDGTGFLKYSNLSTTGSVSIQQVSANEGYRKVKVTPYSNCSITISYTNISQNDQVIITPDMAPIQAGKVIEMPGGSSILVSNQGIDLPFNGTTESHVTFQGVSGSSWSGLQVKQHIEHLTIKDAEYPVVLKTDLTMDDIKVEGGINSVTAENLTGVTIKNSILLNSTSYGILTNNVSTVTISNSQIQGTQNGIKIVDVATLNIDSSLVSDCSDTGISVIFPLGTPMYMGTIDRTTITNCDLGLEISGDRYMGFTLSNSILAFNNVGYTVIMSGRIPSIYTRARYNIFYNTTNYTGRNFSLVEYAIYADPVFVGGNPFDYHLQSGSPAIDAGDPNSGLDPDSTRADMGKYYYDASPAKPLLSISGSWGDNPILSWTDGGEPDLDHFVLKKTYINDSGTAYSYVNIPAGTNTYTDGNITIDPKFGDTIAKYRVKSVDWADNESSYSNQKSTSGSGPQWKQSVDEMSLPERYDLAGNYPNPFNPSTTIRYALPENSLVKVIIYDITGKEIRVLVNGNVTAGYKSIVWDGKDNSGDMASSGAYIYRFIARSLESDNEFSKTQKMLLIR